MCWSCDWSPRDAIGLASRATSRVADRQRADPIGRRRDSARAAPARRRAGRRCCRSRTPNRRAAAATPRRPRAPADRGSRSRTRRGSAGAAAAGPDSASPRPRDRARLEPRRQRRRRSPRPAAACPCGGIAPVRSLRTTFFPRSRAFADGRRDVERVEREAAGLRPLVVTGDAVAIERPLDDSRPPRPACRRSVLSSGCADDGPPGRQQPHGRRDEQAGSGHGTPSVV